MTSAHAAPRPAADGLSSVDARSRQCVLEGTRASQHEDCFVCSPSRPFGLHIDYVPRPGGVEATFFCRQDWEGYRGLVHGGITASLLDGAMMNCLFARGIIAVTADLQVRYRHPLRPGQAGTVTAEVVRQSTPVFVLHARIRQNDRVCATAVGRFVATRGGGPVAIDRAAPVCSKSPPETPT